MGNLVVVGTQWGDEGKGKVVDLLSEQADIIVRFQGGHNAGHTLVVGDSTYKLSLLPSGIIRDGKIAVIGNGVVLDPWKLLDEIRLIQSYGVKINSDRLMIAENAPLIMPYHRELDQDREAEASKKIGTTGRGIGPAYEDKVGRRSIRVSDLRNEVLLKQRLEVALQHHNKLRNYPIKIDWLMDQLMQIKNEVVKYCTPVAEYLNQQTDKNILFEGAQGSMLDVDFGTYPYVTSSNTLAGMASLGSGVAHNKIPNVLGITKAYTTRVGEGPMYTELFDEIGDHLAVVGKEKGTVTGRDRRCGWFDALQVRKTCMINGVTSIALMKIDVLDELEEIKIFDKEYITMSGWKTSTIGITKFEDLPTQAKEYIAKIEELVGVEVGLISTGPERDQTIVKKDTFF
jgi:adenylosuccinate synthase